MQISQEYCTVQCGILELEIWINRAYDKYDVSIVEVLGWVTAI